MFLHPNIISCATAKAKGNTWSESLIPAGFAGGGGNRDLLKPHQYFFKFSVHFAVAFSRGLIASAFKVIPAGIKRMGFPIKLIPFPAKFMGFPTELMESATKLMGSPPKFMEIPTKVMGCSTEFMGFPTELMGSPTKVMGCPIKLMGVRKISSIITTIHY